VVQNFLDQHETAGDQRLNGQFDLKNMGDFETSGLEDINNSCLLPPQIACDLATSFDEHELWTKKHKPDKPEEKE